MKTPAKKEGAPARLTIGRVPGLVIAVSLLVGGTLAILVLTDLRRSRDPATTESGERIAAVRHRPGLEGGPAGAGGGPAVAGIPMEIPPEMPPWESTPENTPLESMPPGHIPAWMVNPPRPDPDQPAPPEPVPPPDPMTHRPPMHNPGGVDGDRPPRAMPEPLPE